MQSIKASTIAVFLALALSAANSISATELAELASQLREATGVPGLGAVEVSADGVEDQAVAGIRAEGSDAPIEPDDFWHLGSNGKAMTAVLAAVLVDKGVIGWDDTVTDHLSDLNVEVHADWRFATLTQLLTHCSGLPANVSRLKMISLAGADADRDAMADRRDYAEDVLEDPPLHEPGSRFVYSNAGYVVAGAMLEAASGKSFADLMRKHVFEPLEMTSAGVGPPGSSDTLDSPRGHRPGLLGFGPVKPGALADNPPALTPAGRFHMALADYGRFLAEVIRGNRGKGRLLDRDAHRLLVESGCSEDYARGWGLADGRLAHAGSNTMWLVMARVDLEQGLAAAITSNDGRLDRQRAEFGDTLDAILDPEHESENEPSAGADR